MGQSQGHQIDKTHLCHQFADDSQREDSSGSDIVFRLQFNHGKPKTTLQECLFACCNCCRCIYTFCCPPIPACIIWKMAFAPPNPTYDFIPFGSAKNGDYRIRLSQDARDYGNIFYPLNSLRTMMRGFYVQSSKNRRRIACLYCRSGWSGETAQKTLLLSHSNAEDLGLMVGRITMLCSVLNVDVLAYDYTGYGQSQGCCSENRLYQNIDDVYEFMTERMKISSNRIIAMGTSLGSAPTIYLASKRQVCAVILQGSFASAVRTMFPQTETTSCIDQFVNVDKIPGVTCPTLFVHGSHDKLFSLEHVQQLMARCPGAAKVSPLIIPGGGHVDFDMHEVYWQRLESFLKQLSMSSRSRGCRVKRPLGPKAKLTNEDSTIRGDSPKSSVSKRAIDGHMMKMS